MLSRPPSLRAVAALEAASRHKSFTRGAAESAAALPEDAAIRGGGSVGSTHSPKRTERAMPDERSLLSPRRAGWRSRDRRVRIWSSCNRFSTVHATLRILATSCSPLGRRLAPPGDGDRGHSADNGGNSLAARGAVVRSIGVRTPSANGLRQYLSCGLAALAMLSSPAQAAAQRKLEIYFIDVEGGQATLLITPDRHTLLIDAGWAGDGAGSQPGDPRRARDAQRIAAAARDVGVRRIDYLLITHFHPDHDGGVAELSRLLPIRAFIDHGGS